MKKTKKYLTIIMVAMIASTMFTGCNETIRSSTDSETSSIVVSESSSQSAETSNENTEKAETNDKIIAASTSTDDTEYFTQRDLSGEYDEASAVKITCSDSTFTATGEGVSVNKNVLTISQEGTYIISGTIKDGRIVVSAGDKDKVQLVFDNCSITSSDFSALNVENADKVFITLADGTKNTIADGSDYSDESVDSAIYSKSTLVINGSGELTVNGNLGHAIVSKDDLKITGGSINVTSVGSAICGKDSVRIANANINITSGGDGIKSTNDSDESKGYVYIESGNINITADNDAIQAEQDVIVLSATIKGTTGGGSSNSQKSHEENFGGWGMWGRQNSVNSSVAASEDSSSAKGLKGNNIIINEATIDFNCADDTLNANGNLEIKDGNISFATGDDGIHADGNVTISGGNVTISESYEGIEALSITINGGNVDVTSSDDGLNATDGESEGGMPGMQNANANPDVFILISGGTLHVNAGGDGLDSNGILTISGGTTYVEGPTNDGNGALDAGSGSTITGGTIIATGSSGMAETFGSSSTQCSILYNFSSSHTGTVTLKDSSGKVIAETSSDKTYNSVVISTPDIKTGEKYTISSGSESAEITLDSTSYSNGGSGMGGMGGMNGNMGRNFGGNFNGGGMPTPPDRNPNNNFGNEN